MDLVVRLFAGLRERAGRERLELADLPEPLDVGRLKALLEERHPELGGLAGVRGVIGTRWVGDEARLEGGEEVSLLPPVSGGSPDDDEELARGLFELRSAALDPDEARRRVAHPSCGGSCLFVGTTRERNRAKEVVGLDYQAFEEMAPREMERIFDECRARFGPPATAGTAGEGGAAELELRMLVLHRTGAVAVGEPSVVVAVASPHRDAAFRACRFLIDELKRRVPLWKKERYADGEHWIGEGA